MDIPYGAVNHHPSQPLLDCAKGRQLSPDGRAYTPRIYNQHLPWMGHVNCLYGFGPIPWIAPYRKGATYHLLARSYYLKTTQACGPVIAIGDVAGGDLLKGLLYPLSGYPPLKLSSNGLPGTEGLFYLLGGLLCIG